MTHVRQHWEITKNEPVKDTLPSSTSTADTARLIKEIKDEFNRINALRSPGQVIHFKCEQSEGDVTYFLNKDEIVKIKVEEQGLGDDYESSEYYYKNGQYFFGYVYTEAGSAGHPLAKETRTYVHTNKTIRYMEDKEIKPCKTCEFSSSSLPYALLNALKAKKSVPEINKLVCE
ncbi:MAG: hypothetical protein WBP45_12790 [Daejeonella sp.]